MNNQSVLGKVVNELTRPQNPNNQSSRRNRRDRGSKSNKSGNGRGNRSAPSRNPGTRPIRSMDNQLALTRSQFTATSPLKLFQIASGSTPGGIRVKGRELIDSTIAAAAITGAYTVLEFSALGTGYARIVPSSFPRLSAYTAIYEWYKFHKVDFLFMSNQPTTATGEVVMSVEYDTKDTAPASTTAQMRNVSATMANIYSDCSCQLLGSLSRLPKFATSQTASADLDQINQGTLYVAVEGVTAASGAGLGYVVAQYDIEFFTPQ